MTFPNIPEDTLSDAAILLAGPAASRAAVYTAEAQIAHALVAIRQAHSTSANCDVCGHFHPLTEHPANAHSEETTPAPVHSYGAVPKLEREAGGDKSGTWDAGDENGPWIHDHAMCDPDRDCGPDNAAPDDAAPGHHWARQVFVGGNRAGKTSAQQQRLMAWTDSELARLATSPLPGPRRLAESFFKDTSPAAEAERAAMQRLNAAAELKDALRVTDEEAMRPAMSLIDGIRTSLPYPGGKLWSAAQEDAGLRRLMADIENEGYSYSADAGDTGGPTPPEDDCCGGEPTYPEGAVLDAEGMDPAYPRTSAEDKLRILADIVDNQSPQGTELADFRRRLSIILGMQ